MNEKEKQLFRALCRFKAPMEDPSLLSFATPAVLGHLFFNRMQGIACDTLRHNGLLGKVNREFRNSLTAAYEQNVQKNQSFFQCISMLSDLLACCPCKVAMLKGAYLCAHYPNGHRTSNDVDLLVLPKDVTAVGNLLSASGFQQGSIRNGELIPATRHEIIESKMTRGETVPYIKEIRLPWMRFFEVDLNFSLDYKSGTDAPLAKMLANTCIKTEKGLSISTLNDADFFLHLCAHLYKEATTLPWIEMQRDMTLYKYCDIDLLLSEMTDTQLQQIFVRAAELGMASICAYAILETMELFDRKHALAARIAHDVLADDPDFRLKVVSPKDQKHLIYQTRNASDRFFLASRTKDLKEVKNHERIADAP